MKLSLTTDDGEVIETWVKVRVTKGIYLMGIDSGGEPANVEDDLLRIIHKKQREEGRDEEG